MNNDERQTSLPQKEEGEARFISGGGGHGFSALSANTGHYAQLNTYDYLADVPGNNEATDLVEVQFKNTRKAYFHNSEGLPLKKGDIVAVESNPGHDIGVVSLTGKLVPLQMKHANLKQGEEIRKIYRLARPNDMERYAEAKAREHDTMIQSRQIAKDLGLEMKIGDVEYQGDGGKAIFYYLHRREPSPRGQARHACRQDTGLCHRRRRPSPRLHQGHPLKSPLSATPIIPPASATSPSSPPPSWSTEKLFRVL